MKLNNATDSTSTTEAATPSAVKAAMDERVQRLRLGIHTLGADLGAPDGTLTQGIVKQ